MTPFELLTELNALDEHSRIEAKSASEVGKSLLETICAFANEPNLGGGWIILGAKQEEYTLFRQYSANGLSDPDKVQRDLVSQCATVFNRPIRVQIESGLVNGKNLLSVFVQEASPGEKPIYFANQPLPGAAFRRQGSADVHCTEDDLVVFYQDRRGDTYDATVIRDADLTTIDPVALADYRRLRSEMNPGAEELKWEDQELLHALRCASQEGGTFRPTVAGILLFGTPQALRRYFPLMRVDYIRVPGREWVQDPERRFETVEIRAPLLTLIRRSRAAILDDLPKAFALPVGQLHRQDIPLIPDRVIREAVVNAVMHRSYRVQGAVQVIRYANRLEIRNPGYSLVAEDRLGEPGSETRNPIIAAVLHEINLAETKGSGIRVMRELMESANLSPPTFNSDRTGNQFIVTCLFHHFLSPEDWTWLRAFGDADLSSEEARALVYAREIGAVDNATYRHLNRVDVLNASTHLRRLRDRNLLEQKGKGSETYYIPTERLIAPWRRLQEKINGKIDTPSQITPGGAPLSSMAESQSSMAEPQSSMAAALEGTKSGPSRDQVTAQDNTLKSHKLQILAEVLGRPAAQVTAQVTAQVALLLDAAADEPKSRDALQSAAGITHREHFRKFYVDSLLEAGWLERTVPNKPTSRLQKYRLTDSGRAWLATPDLHLDSEGTLP